VGFCLSGRKIRSRVFGFSSSFATSTPGKVVAWRGFGGGEGDLYGFACQIARSRVFG
jgi:hypothetical protein